MHVDPKDLQFASMVIASQVKNLRRSGAIRRNEAENFAADLMARLLAVWETYDPARAPREAFINVVVSTQAVSLLRERNAQKRRGEPRSLDAIADLLVDDTAADGKWQHVINLRIDLAGVVPLLTPLQRQLVDQLQRDSLAPIAQQMGIPRSTLRKQCDLIREVFRDAGLEQYL